MKNIRNLILEKAEKIYRKPKVCTETSQLLKNNEKPPNKSTGFATIAF